MHATPLLARHIRAPCACGAVRFLSSGRCNAVQLGMLSAGACRQSLLQQPSCDVLSYKDGRCFLHRSGAPGFFTDGSAGHWTQSKARR